MFLNILDWEVKEIHQDYLIQREIKRRAKLEAQEAEPDWVAKIREQKRMEQAEVCVTFFPWPILAPHHLELNAIKYCITN